MATAPVPLAAPIVAPPSTTVTPLLSVGVVTMSTSKILPLSSSTSLVPTSAILLSMPPSSSSRLRVSLDHDYTSCDTNFVSSFDKNLIRSVGVKKETNFKKVFL